MCIGTSVLCAYSLTVIAGCARQHEAGSYQELVLVMFGEGARQCVQWIVILFNFTGNIASLQVFSSQAAPLHGGTQRQRPAMRGRRPCRLRKVLA